MVPEFLSANSVTIIGQLPIQIMILVIFSQVGTNISTNDPVPGIIYILNGLAIYWFSIWDIMDGNRARRLKCGSPLGRLVDEAGDTITQSNYSVLLAYAFQLNNPYFEIVIFALNSVFYAMEIKYNITGELVMAVGEFSSVEFELLFSILSISYGVFGNAGMYKTIGESLGIASGSACPLHIVCEYQWITILGVALCML